MARLWPKASISHDVGAETTKYAVKKAPFAKAACSHGKSKTDRKWGTNCMFRLVMNPKMKYSTVTVMNGTRYPGVVNVVFCFD